MKTMRWTTTLWVAGLIGILSTGCAPPPAGLSEADQEAIRRGGESWVNSANARDFASVATLYAEDGMLLPPNEQPVRGRAAIEECLSDFPPFSDMTSKQVSMGGSGDVAYVHGTYSMMITLPGLEMPVAERGKFIEIWRKQPDGSWKITHDIFNSDIPIPTPALEQAPETPPAP